jgi:ABC-type nickel/cobalt efflux system permease component RcnA
VFGLDERLAELSGGGGVAVALAVALLLGLRHATDPDHLTAVSTLVLSDERRGGRRAAALGLAWGLGHAATLIALGVPLVLFRRLLPDPLQRAAEVAVGLIIVALAARLLLRWRRGYYHVHPHTHGAVRHAHPHVHEHARDAGHPEAHAHAHAHAERLGRTPLAAFGIGLVHGAGGSAGAGLLLVGATPGRVAALAALLVFALGTAASMAFVSAGFGHALARGPLLRRVTAAIPVLGALGLLFGAWYALGALDTVPYVL